MQFGLRQATDTSRFLQFVYAGKLCWLGRLVYRPQGLCLGLQCCRFYVSLKVLVRLLGFV